MSHDMESCPVGQRLSHTAETIFSKMDSCREKVNQLELATERLTALHNDNKVEIERLKTYHGAEMTEIKIAVTSLDGTLNSLIKTLDILKYSAIALTAGVLINQFGLIKFIQISI